MKCQPCQNDVHDRCEQGNCDCKCYTRLMELGAERQLRADEERYSAACHAIQTGVAFEQGRGSQDGSPKHLRTGVNLRAVDHAALIRLLIAKGVITLAEYTKELADEAEREVKRYEDSIRKEHNVDIKLA